MSKVHDECTVTLAKRRALMIQHGGWHLFTNAPWQKKKKKKKNTSNNKSVQLSGKKHCGHMITCSWTSSISEVRRRMKIGTAPALMTILVCMEVPDAMLVKAQAASNCKVHTRQSGNRPVHKQNICHIPDHFLTFQLGCLWTTTKKALKG